MPALVKTDTGHTVDLEETSLPVLGHTVMMAFRDVEVSHTDLVAIMGEVGLGKYAPKRPPSSKATLLLAVQKWARGRARSRSGEDAASRVGVKTVNSSDGEWIAYLLTVEESDRRQLAIRLDTDVRILLNKATDEMIVTLTSAGGTAEDIADEAALNRELRAVWAGLRDTIASRTVRELLCDLCVAEKGVRMYPGAAVFFLPISKEPITMGLRSLAAELRRKNQDLTLRVYPHINDSLAREEMTETAQASLMAEIETLRDEIGKSEGRENGARAKTIAKRLTEVEAMRAKVAEYAELLDMRDDREMLDDELDRLAERCGRITTNDDIRAQRESEAPAQLPMATGADVRDEREL